MVSVHHSALEARPPSGIEVGSRRQDWITVGLSAWLATGLLIDGYAHENILNTETEDFFTPYHGLFYSGFAAVAIWFAGLSFRSIKTKGTYASSGYGYGLIGLGVFGVGGVSDLIWHQMFGIERGVDALVSPSHLFLLIGLLLIFAPPIATVAARQIDAPTWRTQGPAIASVTLATTVFGFFSFHMWALGKTFPLLVAYDGRDTDGEALVIVMAASMVVTTTILVLVASLMWSYLGAPPGAYVVIYVVPNCLLLIGFGRPLSGAVGSLAAGLIVEFCIRRSKSRIHRSAVFGVSTLALWLGLFAAVALGSEDFAWSPELWLGTAMSTALYGAAIGMQAGPRTPTPAAESKGVSQ